MIKEWWLRARVRFFGTSCLRVTGGRLRMTGGEGPQRVVFGNGQKCDKILLTKVEQVY
jgi:hypothetical protein